MFSFRNLSMSSKGNFTTLLEIFLENRTFLRHTPISCNGGGGCDMGSHPYINFHTPSTHAGICQGLYKATLTRHAEMSKRSGLLRRNKTIRGGKAYGQLPRCVARVNCALRHPLPLLAACELYSHTSVSVIGCIWVVLYQIRLHDWLQIRLAVLLQIRYRYWLHVSLYSHVRFCDLLHGSCTLTHPLLWLAALSCTLTKQLPWFATCE